MNDLVEGGEGGQSGGSGFGAAVEIDSIQACGLCAEDVGRHAVADHQRFMRLQARATQGFFVKTHIGFVVADIHGNIGIFEKRQQSRAFEAAPLQMTETVACRKETETALFQASSISLAPGTRVCVSPHACRNACLKGSIAASG